MPGALPRVDHLDPGAPPAAAVDADPSLVRELVARVQELLAGPRRPVQPATDWAPARLTFGEIALDLPNQTVTRGGRLVRVTQTEFRLLLALVRRRDAIATREELRQEVWGEDSAVAARAVDTHIARLRRKLEPDPKQPRYILTAFASGYRFRP